MKSPRMFLLLFLVGVLAAPLGGCRQAQDLMARVTGKAGAADAVATGGAETGGAAEKATAPVPAESRGKVALLVPFEGCQDKEYATTREALEKAGYRVEVISFYGGHAAGALGGEIRVDRILDDVRSKAGEYDGVVLIGGPGAAFYHNEKQAHELVQGAVKADKVVAAICLAPFTLANAGVLAGRKATAWMGGRFTPEMLGKEGARYRDEAVVVDGRFITANGPDAAADFARAVVKALNEAK